MTRTASPAVALAWLALAACTRQAPPPPDPPKPVAKHVAPAPSRPRPAGRDEAASAERDRRAQAACAYRGGLVEEGWQDRGQAPLGLDATLAGQSARDSCLRSYRRTGQVPELAP